MLKKIPEALKTFSIGGARITAADSARNIGVMIDSSLRMNKQVASIVKTCYHAMRRISRIRRYISDETAQTLVQALITSKLNCKMPCYTIYLRTLQTSYN